MNTQREMTAVQCLQRLIPLGSRLVQRSQAVRFVRGVHLDNRTHLGMAYVVGHDKKQHEFYIRLQEDGRAQLSTRLIYRSIGCLSLLRLEY